MLGLGVSATTWFLTGTFLVCSLSSWSCSIAGLGERRGLAVPFLAGRVLNSPLTGGGGRGGDGTEERGGVILVCWSGEVGGRGWGMLMGTCTPAVLELSS